MAIYYGYVDVPHGSYDEWRNATINNMYDLDGWFSGQCWDYTALCYAQYGLRLYTGIPGVAKNCWLQSKALNTRDPFIAVDGVQNIKRGDILVFGGGYAGHICFADKDYSDSYVDANGVRRLTCLGQNQRGDGSGYPATLDDLNLGGFLGIFRNKEWDGGSPSPTPELGYNKHRYNFVLFNRRKRQEKWTKKLLKRR